MTLSKETAISEMKGRERELVISIWDMRKRHAEELADIRERLYFMKRKNRGADCTLDVCNGRGVRLP